MKISEESGNPHYIVSYSNNRPRYYAEVHGAILVVDSADTARMDAVKSAFDAALAHKWLLGKPMIVFANKQDLEGALTPEQISARFGLPK